jgi:hypothetical protein
MHSSQAVHVAMLALVQALRVALGQHACAPLVSLATGLGLDMPTHPPQRGSRQEICWGDGANLAVKASWWASADRSWPEQGEELGHANASEHTALVARR